MLKAGGESQQKKDSDPSHEMGKLPALFCFLQLKLINFSPPIFSLGRSPMVRIWGLDTEDNGQGAPVSYVLGCVISESERLAFPERHKLREFLLSLDKDNIVFAHNLGYDAFNFDYPEGTLSLSFCRNGDVIKAVSPLGAVFLDTSQFYKCSLKKLGALVGLPKLNYEIEKIRGKRWHELGESERTELTDYCTRDAEITLKAGVRIFELARSLGVNLKSAPTLSTLAKLIYMRKFAPPEIRRAKSPPELVEVQRLGYYGGRCEVFHFGKFQDVYYYDINSAFPFAMLSPLPLPHTLEYSAYYDASNFSGLHGCAFAEVSPPDNMRIPFLPFRHEKTKKLIFPVGRWRGVYTIEELEKSVKLGYDVKVIDGYYTEETAPIFREFVKFFYERKSRANPDEPEYQFYKVLLNSLYGKFAERRYPLIRGHVRHFAEIVAELFESAKLEFSAFSSGYSPIETAETFEGIVNHIAFYNGWLTGRKAELESSPHSLPLLSAYITARCRIMLFDALQKSGEPIYCDTDSVITPDKIPLPLSGELGAWKVRRISEFSPIAPKVYFMDGTPKIKGVSASAVFEGGAYVFERPLRLSESIRRRLPPNLWLAVAKRMRSEYDKRLILADGGTLPLPVYGSSRPSSIKDFLPARKA